MNNIDYLKSFQVDETSYTYFDFNQFAAERGLTLERLPFSIKILVENLLRKFDNTVVKENDLLNIVNWQKSYDTPVEIPFHPARVFMQDFTGVPAVVDLAAMRDAVKALGKDPAEVNPKVPTELIIDHSVQVDKFGTRGCL